MGKIWVKLFKRGLGRFWLLFFGLWLAGTILFYGMDSANNLAAAPDFYAQWHGTRVALEGGNPYSAQTTLETQLYLRGAPVPPQEDQLVFVYPFYSVYLTVPLAALPYEWAAALWVGLLLAGALLSSQLVLTALAWPSARLPRLVVYLLVLLSAPFAASVLLGQMALLVYALVCVAFWAIQRRYFGLAGFMLALATVKPTLVVLIIPACLILAWRNRSWKFFGWFGVTLLGLTLAALVWQPDWIGQFLKSIGSYGNFKQVATGPEFIFAGLPGGLPLAWLGWGLLAFWLVYSWFNTLGWGRLPLSYSFALTMLLTLVLLPETNIINNLFLLFPLLVLMQPYPKQAWPWLLLLGVVIVGSWLLYLWVHTFAYGWALVLPQLLLLPFFALRFRQILTQPIFSNNSQPAIAPN